MNKSLFLEELFKDNSGYIDIREFNKTGGVTGRHFMTLPQAQAQQWPGDKNIWFGVYARGDKRNGKAAGCTSTAALWLDFDNMNLQEVRARLEVAGLPPGSIYVNSGGGVHAYWLLTRPAKENVTPILKAMAAATGADIRAAEKARVMRLPETFNVKYNPARLCGVIEAAGHRYELELFKELLNVKLNAEPNETAGVLVTEKQENFFNKVATDRPCIEAMLEGVPEGERNFALGRLTKWLQLKGYTNKKSMQVILNWNQRNRPPENREKVIRDFQGYWHGDYQLLGCRIDRPELQQVLAKYCNRPECKFNMPIGNIELHKSEGYNNRLLNNLHRLTGNDLIIYGLLVRHDEGLTTSVLIEKLTPQITGRACMSDKTMRRCLRTLQAAGFITETRGNRRAGRENLYKAIPQGTYGLGYTAVSNGAINGAIDGRVTPGEFRLYVLLLKYGFNKGACYPSLTTLAKDLGVTYQAINWLLRGLERADYIKRFYKQWGEVEKLDMRLLV